MPVLPVSKMYVNHNFLSILSKDFGILLVLHVDAFPINDRSRFFFSVNDTGILKKRKFYAGYLSHKPSLMA